MSTKSLPLVLGVLALSTGYVAWWPEPVKVETTVNQSPVLGTKVSTDQIASLRVATFDPATKTGQILEIAKANGVWTIPSSFDFPADGNTRVTKVAAGFLGIEKGRQVTSEPKDFQNLEVLDPLDQNSQASKGLGKRLTMKDQGGATVLDLVVGKYVEGSQSLYYVREIGKNEVYTAKVDPWDLSTRFVDYVETDPFKIDKGDIRSLAVKDYTLDLTQGQGTVQQRSETAFARKDQAADWDSPQVPDGKRVKKEAVDGIMGELTGLKLVGVRPCQKSWMAPCGFYPDKAGNLYGSEGGLVANTREGLRYELYFGRVSQDDNESAPPPEQKAPGSDTAATPASMTKTSNRYLLMVVRYDPAQDEDAKAVAAAGSDTAAAASAQKRMESHKATADKLQKRFLQFFYVVTDESFKKLRPALEAVFEAKPPEPMAGNTGKTVKQWLADKAKEDGVTATASGLLYQALASGPADGKAPTDSDQVVVKYKGSLVDGTEFDSSKDGTATFRVTQVIKGWTEALKLMKPGDKWRLFIPPELGYGDAGSPPKIPGHSILVFEVEMVQVK